MTEREFQIGFERQLIQILPQYEVEFKLTSDTIFFYINKAKDFYIRDLYRVFQQNQELSDKLRTLVKTKEYTSTDFKVNGNEYSTDYPADYVYALGERILIQVTDNECDNLITKSCDVLEATIESVDRQLENSLSEYHLKYNQAKPIRVYTDNKIILYTDGKYSIKNYWFTYLTPAKELGNNLDNEYTDLPENTHKEIIDIAVNMFIQQKTLTAQKESNND